MTVGERQKTKNITAILIEAGVVTDARVAEGLARQSVTGRRIGETLVELGAATEEDIAWALARQLALPFVDLPLDAVDRDLVRGFEEPLLRRFQAVPLVRDERGLSVAVADPTDAEAQSELERRVPERLSYGVATPARIRAALDHAFGRTAAAAPMAAGRDWRRELAPATPPPAEVALLHQCLEEAARRGTGEVHLVSEPGRTTVWHGVGSELAPAGELPEGAAEGVLRQLEGVGFPPLDATGHGRGRIRGSLLQRPAAVDVFAVRAAHGVALRLAIRGFPEGPPRIRELGLPEPLGEALRALLEVPEGVLVIAGPPGSGLTTTLAAFAAEAASRPGRVLYFGREREPAPARATAVLGPPERLRDVWQEIAVGQDAGVVFLDRVLDGAEEQVFAPAGVGRLVVAGCTAASGMDCLARLLRRRATRAAAAERLLGVLAQRFSPEERAFDGPGRVPVFEFVPLREGTAGR